MPITKKKFSYTLNLSEKIKKVKPSKRKEVTKEIGDFLLDQIVTYLDKSNTPVKDGEFKKKLSKDYAKKTGKKTSDLYLKGDMLASLKVDNFKDRVTIKITDGTQKKKAYNHSTAKTDENPLPKRQFLPNESEDETFKKPIIDGINRIINNASEGDGSS